MTEEEEEENVARLRDIRFRSLAGGAQGLAFTSGGGSKQEVREYFRGRGNDWEMVHHTVDELIAQRDRVVVLGHCCFTHRTTGKRAETPKVDIWRFAGGKAVELMELYDTATVFAAAG